ncbi:MAG: hypothetical protein A2Y10_05120 [Planctomycetes bacterium GWF2_41_51]|nr:MAG: hypothetical protein A2Y10_05120 [Planctomycetes bacterium GWF2_41_51]HBG25554.1 hypothetical protein [Phycisphaerales bacterium]
MPINNFPFLRLSPSSPLRPVLFTKIVYPNTGLMLDEPAIIDTGADICAAPAELAEDLGIDLERGIPKPVSTGNGVAVAFTHICRIEVYHTANLLKGCSDIVYKMVDISVDFMPDLPFVLLGTKDFLGQFCLIADYPSKLFSVKHP